MNQNKILKFEGLLTFYFSFNVSFNVGFTPGDYIVHEEDCVDAVYFLVRGHVKILRDGDVIGILSMSVIYLSVFKSYFIFLVKHFNLYSRAFDTFIIMMFLV